jgi:hypothetical protein
MPRCAIRGRERSTIVSSAIRVRGYVVGCGDCVLLRLPDGTQTRHVLVGFGRAPNDPASLQRFPAIARDIEKQCNGHLDLVVLTHEHLDHMEGFYREREVFDRMQVDRVWMGLPSDPDYYENYPKAKLQQKLRSDLAQLAAKVRRQGLILHPAFQTLLENNLSSTERVDYLRNLGRQRPAYLARGVGRRAAMVFKDVRIRVLAPEPDVSMYYSASSREKALTAALAATNGLGQDDVDESEWTFPAVPRAAGRDHAGLSSSDFERLRRAIREDGVTAARFIDKAANNTSLCLLIEAGGKRLLLPGDAEIESWGIMAKKFAAEMKKPVDFLKVAHLGSHNGTPSDLLDGLLPKSRKDKAQILVSTKIDVYGTTNPVLDASLMADLKSRCRKLVTTDGKTGSSVELEI